VEENLREILENIFHVHFHVIMSQKHHKSVKNVIFCSHKVIIRSPETLNILYCSVILVLFYYIVILIHILNYLYDYQCFMIYPYISKHAIFLVLFLPTALTL